MFLCITRDALTLTLRLTANLTFSQLLSFADLLVTPAFCLLVTSSVLTAHDFCLLAAVWYVATSALLSQFWILMSIYELFCCQVFAHLPACVDSAVVKKRRDGRGVCPSVDWKETSELICLSNPETPFLFKQKDITCG